ncbi:MAG: TIGR03936 family radical SAM-associated protein [Candidatus Omnitrophota bacterium]
MTKKRYKIEFRFSKLAMMRFISHLDLMRVFTRALRRTGINIYFSEGFSPHPKISFKRALKLGEESLNEEAAFYLLDDISPEDFRLKLNQQLPEGIKIEEAYLSQVI